MLQVQVAGCAEFVWMPCGGPGDLFVCLCVGKSVRESGRTEALIWLTIFQNPVAGGVCCPAVLRSVNV